MTEIRELEISTDCSCVDEMDDGEFKPSQDCYGCWDDLMEMYGWDIYQPWIEANCMNEATVVVMRYANLDWDRKAGAVAFQVKELEEFEPLKINGDFTLRWKLDGKKLTVTRSSHDEYGASFEFEVTQNYCQSCCLELAAANGQPDFSRNFCKSCSEAVLNA